MQRKRRTRAHVIADLAVNHVERFVLRCGWTVLRVIHDYGIDLLMDTFDAGGEVENGRVSFQLKATDNLARSADGTAVSIRIEWSNLLFWLNEELPVILILYDAQQDRAFWLYIQEFFRGHRWAERSSAATKVTVHIPVTNEVNEAAVREFARLRDESVTGRRRDGSDD